MDGTIEPKDNCCMHVDSCVIRNFHIVKIPWTHVSRPPAIHACDSHFPGVWWDISKESLELVIFNNHVARILAVLHQCMHMTVTCLVSGGTFSKAS